MRSPGFILCEFCPLLTENRSGICDDCEKSRAEQAEKFEKLAVKMQVRAMIAHEQGRSGPLGCIFYCNRRDYASKVAERFGGDASAAVSAWAGYDTRELAAAVLQ